MNKEQFLAKKDSLISKRNSFEHYISVWHDIVKTLVYDNMRLSSTENISSEIKIDKHLSSIFINNEDKFKELFKKECGIKNMWLSHTNESNTLTLIW